MFNSVQNTTGYKPNFGIKINPELVKEANIPKSIINRFAQFGDRNTVLEGVKLSVSTDEGHILSISDRNMGSKEFTFEPKVECNSILDILKQLTSKDFNRINAIMFNIINHR